MKTIGLIVLASALAVLGAGEAVAQDAGVRTLSVRAGGLTYDRGGDATNLLLGVGADWTLARHLVAEVEASWSPAPTTLHTFANPGVAVDTRTHLLTATTGLQAQAVIGRVRPYAGMAAGLFVHYDEHGGGDRFPRYTIGFPAGVRLAVTDRVVLRGELRARFDTHQDGGSGTNVEQTLGLSLRF